MYICGYIATCGKSAQKPTTATAPGFEYRTDYIPKRRYIGFKLKIQGI